MRIVPAPKFSALIGDPAPCSILSRISDPLIQQFVAESNSQYYHWDKFRRRPLPKGITAEQGWLAIKVARSMSRRVLPLATTDGQPFTLTSLEASQQLLHLVDRHAGDLLALPTTDKPTLIEIEDRILIDSHMEEAIATSQIEGAVTTRVEARKMLKSGRKPTDKSEQMIVNGYRTIRLLAKRAAEPLTVDLLHDVQRSMTENTLDDPDHTGRFRTPSDGPVEVIDVRNNEVIYTPPPADQVAARMTRLIDFANATHADSQFIHPLVKASVLHFWLAYEHPYNDGNGRTARALFYWYMLKSGFWLFRFLTISRVINQAQMRYYRAFLYTETDENDLTYFVQYMVKTTWQAIEELRERIQRLTEQDIRMRQIVTAGVFNRRQRALLDHAIRHPSDVVTFESHGNSNGISQVTARNDVLDLLRRGVLIEVGRQRPREFAPVKDLLHRIKQTRQATEH